jgi:serralysin
MGKSASCCSKTDGALPRAPEPAVQAAMANEGDMARDPNGSNNGTDGNDILWGKALVLSDGTYDNYSDFASDALRGFGGDDLIFGDIYNDGDDHTEGDTAYGGDGNDVIYGDCGADEPNW